MVGWWLLLGYNKQFTTDLTQIYSQIKGTTAEFAACSLTQGKGRRNRLRRGKNQRKRTNAAQVVKEKEKYNKKGAVSAHY